MIGDCCQEVTLDKLPSCVVPKGNIISVNFGTWLQLELDRRGWGPGDLLEQSRQRGYPLSRVQLWRIINNERKAGPDACIAIAAGLGIAREEVFRARGWLLREPEKLIEPDKDDPRLVELVHLIQDLPDLARDHVLDAWRAALRIAQAIASARPPPHTTDLKQSAYETGEADTSDLHQALAEMTAEECFAVTQRLAEYIAAIPENETRCERFSRYRRLRHHDPELFRLLVLRAGYSAEQYNADEAEIDEKDTQG